MRQRLAGALAPIGLTPEQLELLRLVGSGLTSPRQIYQASGRDKTTLSRAVSRAVKAGLIAQERRPDDKRRTALALTARGEQLLRTADRAALEAAPQIVGSLGPRKRKRLAKLVAKLASTHAGGSG